MMSKGIPAGLIETSKHIKKRRSGVKSTKEKSAMKHNRDGAGMARATNGINNNRCSAILRYYGSADVFDNATIGVVARYRPHLTCQYRQKATDDGNYMTRFITLKKQ